MITVRNQLIPLKSCSVRKSSYRKLSESIKPIFLLISFQLPHNLSKFFYTQPFVSTNSSYFKETAFYYPTSLLAQKDFNSKLFSFNSFCFINKQFYHSKSLSLSSFHLFMHQKREKSRNFDSFQGVKKKSTECLLKKSLLSIFDNLANFKHSNLQKCFLDILHNFFFFNDCFFLFDIYQSQLINFLVQLCSSIFKLM